MTKHALDWKAVFAAGQKAGAKYEAVKKWKQRDAVPFKYRYKIMQITGGAIKMADFDDADVSKIARPPKKRAKA